MGIAKLDLEMAYDHVNWDFLLYMLKRCGSQRGGDNEFRFVSQLFGFFIWYMAAHVGFFRALKVFVRGVSFLLCCL